MNPASDFLQTLLKFCSDRCTNTCCSAYEHCSSTYPENYREDDSCVSFPSNRWRTSDERKKRCALRGRIYRRAICKEANEENRRWRADTVCNRTRRSATFLHAEFQTEKN